MVRCKSKRKLFNCKIAHQCELEEGHDGWHEWTTRWWRK